VYQLGGFVEGERNDGMYNVAVYLRKRFPGSWQDTILEYNQLMCGDSALPLKELTAIAKSVGKKDYDYRCKHGPINKHCNRGLCLKRQFGVGGGTSNLPEIGQMTKYVGGDPVIWCFEIAGQRVQMTTDELTTQKKFSNKVVEITGHFIKMTPARFTSWLGQYTEKADVVEIPQDATPVGQFKILLRQFCYGMAQATSKEELIHRLTPFNTGTGEVWFRSRGLLDYLAHHGYKIKSEAHVWQMLRNAGVTKRQLTVKGENFEIWVVPDTKEIQEDAPLPKFGTTEF